jgi:hypothetical protein
MERNQLKKVSLAGNDIVIAEGKRGKGRSAGTASMDRARFD